MPIPHNVTQDFFLENKERFPNIPNIDEPAQDVNVLSMLLGFLLRATISRDPYRNPGFVSYSIIEISSGRPNGQSTLVVVENRASTRPHYHEPVEVSRRMPPVHLSFRDDHDDNLSDLFI